MNRMYYEIVIKEAYDKGKEEGSKNLNQLRDKINTALVAHKNKDTYINKKIRKLLEDLIT